MSTLQISNNVNSPSGPWLIWEPRVLDGIMAMNASVQQIEQRASSPVAGNQARVAIVNINGVLTKQGSWWGTSTSQIASVVTSIANSNEYDAIVLRIDSVGGHSAGIPDAAQAIKEASQKMRVIASIEDYGASAAYYLASQATEIYANSSAVVGSIGTLMVIPDASHLYESQGIKMHVIASGKFKGMGAMGAPVSEAHLAEFQKIVTQTNELFLSAVQSGRNLSDSQMAEISDARVFNPKESVGLGLIDGVASFAQVLDIATAKGKKSMTKQETETAATEQQEQKPTALQRDEQLKTLCKGSTAEFRLSMIVADASDTYAMQKWIEHQESVIAAQTQQISTKEHAEVVAVSTGVAASQEVKTSSQVDSIQAWNEAVEAKRKAGFKGYQAVAAVAQENPTLRDAYNLALQTK